MKRGQVWVETVLYTLIGLALIGLILAFVTPKINESKDKLIIEQTISSLNDIDEKISAASQSPGNRRNIELTMKRGQLTLDSLNNQIIFELPDSRAKYSEPGIAFNVGRIKVLTEEAGKNYKLTLSIAYNQNLTFNGKDESRVFSQAATPYKFFIEYKEPTSGNKIIDIIIPQG